MHAGQARWLYEGILFTVGIVAILPLLSLFFYKKKTLGQRKDERMIFLIESFLIGKFDQRSQVVVFDRTFYQKVRGEEMYCSECGSKKLIRDNSFLYCRNCGMVMQELYV